MHRPAVPDPRHLVAELALDRNPVLRMRSIQVNYTDFHNARNLMWILDFGLSTPMSLKHRSILTYAYKNGTRPEDARPQAQVPGRLWLIVTHNFDFSRVSKFRQCLG